MAQDHWTFYPEILLLPGSAEHLTKPQCLRNRKTKPSRSLESMMEAEN
jgi:hypothetical protein